MRKGSIALLTALAAVLGFASNASGAGIYYGSAKAPIKAEDNSPAGNAWYYGAFGIIENTWIRNRYWYRDSAPGGNKAYVDTVWMTCTPPVVGGGSCWEDAGYDRSSNTTSEKYVLGEDWDGLDFIADKVRGRSHVCEDQNNAPDDCSRYSVGTFPV